MDQRLPRFVMSVAVPLMSFSLVAQNQAPASDPMAVTIATRSIDAMVGSSSLPSDSRATAVCTIVEGSKTSRGTLQIMTRGSDQTSEQLTFSDGNRGLIYSHGSATETINSATISLPLERAVTAQSVYFSLPLTAASLKNPDFVFKYVALETVEGLQVHHIRFWNTFRSVPSLVGLAPLSSRDIWIDVTTGLPFRLAYERRDDRVSSPRVPVAVTYRNYQRMEGIMVPFETVASLNGTPWASISIQSIEFNVGLADSLFPVE